MPSQHAIASPDHDAVRYGSVRDGVCVVAPDWRIRYANASLLEILRLVGGGQGIATLWDALPPPWQHTPEADALRRAMTERDPARFRIDPSRAEGRVWEVEAQPLPTGELRVRLRNATGRAADSAPAGAAPTPLSAALAQSGIGLAVVEFGSWAVVDANPAAQSLLGNGAGPCVGRRLPELLPDWERGPLPSTLAGVAAEGGSWIGCLDLTREGTRRLRVEARRVEPDAGHARTRLALTLLDVSEPAGTLPRPERGNRAVFEVVAALTHELRTPLTALEGYASLLADGMFGPVTEAQAGALARMRVTQRHLLDFIEQVLDAARLDAGARRAQRVRIDAGDLVAAVVESLAPAAEVKGLWLEFRAVRPLPLETDPDLLRQIVTNMVGNALKFTERGGVTVTVQEGERGAEVAVTDTGSGIPAEHLDHIWEPFYQAEPSRPGTGLGLALSREYASLLGGEICVRSQSGLGSTFVLTLPAAPAGNSALGLPSPSH